MREQQQNANSEIEVVQCYQNTKRDLLANNYMRIIERLTAAQKLEDVGLANKCKSKCALAILQQTCPAGQQSMQKQLDIEQMIDVCYSLLFVQQNKGHETNVHQILSALVRSDCKYAFVMYKNKINSLAQTEFEDIAKRLKYLGCLHLFIIRIIQSADLLFSDFIELAESFKAAYENQLMAQQQLIGQHALQARRRQLQLQHIYTGSCQKILESCSQLANSKQANKRRIFSVLSAAISHIFVMRCNSPAIQSRLLQFIQTVLSNRVAGLAIELASLPPLILLMFYSSAAHYATFLSSQIMTYAAYRILLQYSPSTTMPTQVGGAIDKITPYIQRISMFVCETLLQNNQCKELKIQGNAIWINSNLNINLIQVYSRLTILCGFINKQSQCFKAISQVISFSHNSYKQCPTSIIQIWAQLLKKASQKQLEYRIFCIGKLRKVLIDCKNQLINNKFQLHHQHSHSPAIVQSCSSASKQLDIILTTKDGMNDTNYIGHVISFISNVLLCIKKYDKKYNNHHVQIHREGKLEIQAKCKTLQTKITQLMELNKDQSKNNELELILFRCQQLSNQ